MVKIVAIRKHEIHAGHRVYGHTGKCKNLHGHSYVVHFHCQADILNDIGMVIDFGLIKTTLCKWLEDNYDHRMLIWENDPILEKIQAIDSNVVMVPYNPTAENMAHYLLTEIAPKLLNYTGISVNKIIVEETSKCRAECEL